MTIDDSERLVLMIPVPSSSDKIVRMTKGHTLEDPFGKRSGLVGPDFLKTFNTLLLKPWRQSITTPIVLKNSLKRCSDPRAPAQGNHIRILFNGDGAPPLSGTNL